MYLHQLYMAPMQAVRTPECHPSQLCSFWLDVKHGRRKDTELESRMMRKYPVRFGGGPGEKAAMTSLAVYPTSAPASGSS
jgi:hypothetical protein